MIHYALLSFAVAAIVSLVSAPLLRRAALRTGVAVASSGAPRVGGIAVFLGVCGGCAAVGFLYGWADVRGGTSPDTIYVLIIPVLMIFIVGVVDDTRGLSPGPRVFIEAAAKKLVLTHFYPGLEPEVARRGAARVYDGPIELARDGSVHRLS